jgi:hypothetical protein
MSRGVADLSQVLSRKQILLAFGSLVVKELDKNGYSGNKSEIAEEPLPKGIVERLAAEAVGMALEKRSKK